jgi:hypothetical protein
VFTARYALSPYIKQIRFVFKGLMTHTHTVKCTEVKRFKSSGMWRLTAWYRRFESPLLLQLQGERIIDDEGITILKHVGKTSQFYTASNPRSLESSSVPLRVPQISIHKMPARHYLFWPASQLWTIYFPLANQRYLKAQKFISIRLNKSNVDQAVNKTDMCKRFTFPHNLQWFLENQCRSSNLYDKWNKLEAVLLPVLLWVSTSVLMTSVYIPRAFEAYWPITNSYPIQNNIKQD